jgi:hypothetical protein
VLGKDRFYLLLGGQKRPSRAASKAAIDPGKFLGRRLTLIAPYSRIDFQSDLGKLFLSCLRPRSGYLIAAALLVQIVRRARGCLRNSQYLVRRVQHRQHVGADEDETADAGGGEGGFALAWAAGEADVLRAGPAQRLRGGFGFLCVELI